MLNKLIFYIIYSLLYLLSLLPFAVWYFISDGLFLVLYYVVGYRKKMAYENLRRSFPAKTEAEIRVIHKAFFHHLCDLVAEFFKEMTMSKDTFSQRMKILNPEIFEEIAQKDKGVLMLATHFGNFEWMTTMTDMASPVTCYGIYAPLKSVVAERLMVKTRERWGGKLLPVKDAIRNSLAKLDEKCVIGFVCDQTPSRREQLYFTQFLHQTTAVHDRMAHLVLQKEADTFFVKVKKVKRGYYTLEYINIPIQDFLPYSVENAQKLTDFYTEQVEKMICEQPEIWLWTHRRWKHSPKGTDILSAKLKVGT